MVLYEEAMSEKIKTREVHADDDDKVVQYLDRKSVHYETYNLTELNRDTNFSRSRALKSLLLRSDAGFILAIAPLANKLHYANLRKTLSVKNISLANEEELRQVMDCAPGTCHPFGGLVGVATVIDSDAAGLCGVVYFSSGVTDIIIGMDICDYLQAEDPVICDICLPKTRLSENN